MAEFVKIELLFHAKALEMYTQCYHCLHTQSPDNDLQVSVSLSVSLSVCVSLYLSVCLSVSVGISTHYLTELT